MDLENFEETTSPAIHIDKITHPEQLQPKQALSTLDEIWYQPATRRARWMDLLGDYSGREAFIIEGDSLLQTVLNDPMLSLGQENDVSFQLLHAKFLLENLLSEFTTRDANFTIVFFQCNRHSTIKTGSKSFIASSRALARKMLFHHILNLDIRVSVFNDPKDPEWIIYTNKYSPMFVLANDGSVPRTGDHNENAAILLQRGLLFQLSQFGLAFALLNGARFQDSKISTFVFESKASPVSKAISVFVNCNMTTSLNFLNQTLQLETPLLPTGPVALPFLFSQLVQTDGLDQDLLCLFILHMVLLQGMPVALRARALLDIDSSLTSTLENFLPPLFNHLASRPEPMPDLDGRIFLELIAFVTREHPKSLASFLPSAVVDALPAFDFLSIDLARFSQRYPFPLATPLDVNPIESYTLLPFSNIVFDEALASIRVSAADTEPRPRSSIFGQEILLRDVNHWHSHKSILPSYLGGRSNAAKPLGGHGNTAKPKGAADIHRERKRHLKREQIEQDRLQKQAASLTGASGKVLHRIVIPSGPTSTKGTKVKVPVKALPKKSSGADKLRAKIQADRSKHISLEATTWWKDHLKTIKGQSLDAQSITIDRLKCSTSPKAAYPPIALEIRLYQLHIVIKTWLMASEVTEMRDGTIRLILRILGDIQEAKTPVSSEAHKFMTDLLLAIGFEAYSAILLPQSDTKLPALSFEPIKLFNRKRVAEYPFMRIEEHPIKWQLEHYGEYMDRSMDSAPDPRVVFDPDLWQRNVLDAIDRRDSVLALAPTSAGKTFISFYAMEQVLRQSHNDVLVYVAPTKALVNQIAAEVYGRFSKTYHGSETLLAVKTRDTQSGDIQRAQILITVPEMLAILLLSPTLAGNWSSRIKRIILDEIHCIGHEDGGAVWEQIILMAPCPIIGLSATVGSPDQFNNWLQSVQTTHKFEHICIHHSHRYSHLRKFFFLPSSESAARFHGLAQHSTSNRMEFIHPISLLSEHVHVMPSDLALEARDCLTLFNALKQLQLTHGDELDPRVFFRDRQALLTQKDILSYEAALKAVVAQLPFDDLSSFIALTSLLRNSRVEVPATEAPPSRAAFIDHLLTLVCDLHSQGNLPAILFNFDRADCEIMARSLTQRLVEAEDRWKEGNKWKQRLAQVEKWRAQQKVRGQQHANAQKQKKDKDAAPSAEPSPSTSWEAAFDEDAPLEDFSFAGRSSEAGELIDELMKWGRTKQWAIDALRRGIAVHHAGMSKMYRVAVEGLFRQGYIRLMIATGTLAMGINAPARTSVFCGDSPYMTALMYRQCAGRAGRRGFDLLGNVVFYGLPYSRVQRLVLSRLPELGDSFPLTSTLILRLFNLLEGSNYAEFSVASIKSILDLPRISHRSEMGRDHVLHHTRFSIEYLCRLGLLNGQGHPINMFKMASHLYYTEPSNFALIHLFESGIIHRICSQSKVQAESELLLLFCHLFDRKFIHSVYANPLNIERLTKKYPSKIVLPPLPRPIGQELERHEAHILKIFSGYAISYAREHASTLGVDDRLALSGRDTLPPSSVLSSPFVAHLGRTSLKPMARSIFAANSGLDDHFYSVTDLVRTVRKGIHLHEHAIPSMHQLIAHSDVPNVVRTDYEHQLNAYILDFYTHGQLPTLTNANGIRSSDVWFLLQDFDLVLKTIKTSLQDLLMQLSTARSAARLAQQGSKAEGTEDVEDDSSRSLEDSDSSSADEPDDFQRPRDTIDADWRVYATVGSLSSRFSQKFRKMWA